jgi:hypothetical protein
MGSVNAGVPPIRAGAPPPVRVPTRVRGCVRACTRARLAHLDGNLAHLG